MVIFFSDYEIFGISSVSCSFQAKEVVNIRHCWGICFAGLILFRSTVLNIVIFKIFSLAKQAPPIVT